MKTIEDSKLVSEQVDPVQNSEKAVWDLVIGDMAARDQEGLRKYKTRLQPFNGRDALIDLYQELLDAVVYTRQVIEEKKSILAILQFYAEGGNDGGLKAATLLSQLGER